MKTCDFSCIFGTSLISHMFIVYNYYFYNITKLQISSVDQSVESRQTAFPFENTATLQKCQCLESVDS